MRLDGKCCIDPVKRKGIRRKRKVRFISIAEACEPDILPEAIFVRTMKSDQTRLAPRTRRSPRRLPLFKVERSKCVVIATIPVRARARDTKRFLFSFSLSRK